MPAKNLFKKSIKTKVIVQVTVIIALILSLALGFIIYLKITHLQEIAQLNLKNRAHTLSHNINARLEFLKETTELFSNNELLVNAFIDEEDKDKYLPLLVKNFREGKFLTRLSLVDFDGRVIYQTEKTTSRFNQSQELRLSLNLAQSINYCDAQSNQLIFIVPVKYYATTQGAIIASYDMKKIVDKVNEFETSIYTKLIKNGKIIYSKNYNSDKNYYTYLENNIQNNHTRLSHLQIAFELGVEDSVYLQVFKKEVLVLSLLGLLILVIGGAVSYFLARTITQPILKLYKKVNSISFEDAIQPYEPLGSDDELDILGHSFYKKEQELYDLNQNLDQKVKEATNAYEEERNRFLLAVEGAQDGLWDWNLKTGEIIFSERFETMLGYKVGDIPRTSESWFGLLHPDDRAYTEEVVETYLNTKGAGSYQNTFRLRAKDGSWIWILGRGKAQFDSDGTPLRFVGFNTDITHQIEYQKKLDHIAKHDALTHLPNRFLLSELLTHTMHIVQRNHQYLALLFIDLDGFKHINDTFGHEAGDEVLSTISRRMSQIVRASDIVSRIGGDEFVIVVSDLDNTSEVIPLLQRLLSDLAATISYNKQMMSVSASIGVSFYPQEEDIGNEALIRQADQAMYSAKLSGKNQYQFFNVEASVELKEQQLIILNLREALKKDQFELYYQPKVAMSKNKVIGLEALLRWNHPENGLLFPDTFLPLVEHESSFMIELGTWVFEHAFAQLETWHLEGFDFSLSINVSSYEVQKDSFASYLKKLFKAYPHIKPNTIEIELLETVAFDNFNLTSKTLQECQKLGISIAIDDFGTGYASLNYLKQLPLSTLKIDKSFVMDLLTSSQNLSIVEASIGLAHAFGSHVVAEGVESEEQGKVLIQLGCEIAQGYCIAKPMPAAEILTWIENWKGFDSWEKTTQLSSKTLPILHSAIEHRHWIEMIENFIHNETTQLPQLEVSRCYLGNWLAHGASKELQKYPEFESLQNIHHELHHFAEALLRASDAEEKQAGIETLKRLRKEIIQKLEQLISYETD